ncbi:MAG: O-antigen ligase family protein [Bacteroidales bacterium]|nr:O-antigen ligase family protein [Bacteroidales bacterium]
MGNNWHTWFGKSISPGYFIGVGIYILVIILALYYDLPHAILLCFAPLLLYYSLYGYEKIYYFIVYLTPLSIGLQWIFPQIPINLSLPSELLMILLLFILIFKFLKTKSVDIHLFTHPVSLAILFYLFWMFVTSITSSMPLVSFKHLIAQGWFVVTLYFFPLILFKKIKRIYLFYALYIIAFSFVIIYSINKHLSFGLFDKNAAHFVMKPFYNDHTSYGAILAMYLPVLAGLIFLVKRQPLLKLLLFGVLALYLVAIVLSYTRAAWISVVMAFVLFLLMLLRIKMRYLIVAGSLAVLLLFSYRTVIIDKLSKNKQDSSTELSEHIRSMSNIATDASNLERINRWNSALKMFEERPVFGWGPGTYMFQYAPFQMARDKTIISTNFAEGGNAHSEYIGPLAEEGVLGVLAVLLILFFSFQSGFSAFNRISDKPAKTLVLISLLSLTTYFIHGLLNNYLDTDKAAVPFWGMLAVIVSIDLFSKKNPQLGGAEER